MKPATWKRGPLLVPRASGETRTHATAYSNTAAPGLALVPNPYSEHHWRIIQASSGLSIFCVGRLTEAKRAALALAPILDWLPAGGINGASHWPQGALERVRAVMVEHGGRVG